VNERKKQSRGKSRKLKRENKRRHRVEWTYLKNPLSHLLIRSVVPGPYPASKTQPEAFWWLGDLSKGRETGETEREQP